MAIYYISATGNDLANGTTTGTPWQTLTKVNSTTFSAGDQILFQRGCTFYGSLTINQSGTTGNPITFGAYGSGANPIITGFTDVTSWLNLGGNIWESTNAVSTLSTCNMVTINGVNTTMGRYPNVDAGNGGYLTFQSHSGQTSITSSSLTGTPNWTGAEVIVRANNYTINRNVITSQSGGTLNYATSSDEPQNGFGFFLQNDLKTLTYQNAWYYNPSTKKLRIYSTSQPSNVNVATVNNIVTVHGSYITMDRLTITGSNSDAIYNEAGSDSYNNSTIINCTISFSGKSAIRMRMQYFVVQNNTISDSNSNGIIMYYQSGDDSTIIRNNNISNSGQLVGMLENSNTGNGIIILSKGHTTIDYNNVLYSGYSGIILNNSYGSITNNFVNNFSNVLDDGGGIYCYQASYHSITSNIVTFGIGAHLGTNYSTAMAHGIYLDEGCNNSEVSYNSISDCASYGLFEHMTTVINAHHNTIFNCQTQFLQYDSGNTMLNNQFNYNILVAKASNQYIAEFDFNTAHSSSLGTLDHNIYARPISDTNAIRVWLIDGTATDYTLAQWKALYSKDTNSTKSPISVSNVNDIHFIYNETRITKNFTLSTTFTDMFNVSKSGTLTLQPYTSIVLLGAGTITEGTTLHYIMSGSYRIMSGSSVVTITN